MNPRTWQAELTHAGASLVKAAAEGEAGAESARSEPGAFVTKGYVDGGCSTSYFALPMSSDSPPSGRSTSSQEKGREEEQPDAPPSSEPSQAKADAPLRPERCNLLLLSLVSFCFIGFGVWVVSAGKRYREEYAQVTEGWRVGSTREVELTLVKEDKRNLACASDQVIAGLRCGYRRNLQEAGPVSPSNPHLLQPYNTVGNELLLGAGLWTSPDLKEPLPHGRFTVVCNYNIKGVVKSTSVRFDPTASFGPVGKTVTLGTLSDCVLPR